MGQEEILLKEYETCQSDIDSITSHYWTIVGVFIAITSALLGALPFGMLQSGSLNAIFKEDATRVELLQLLMLTLFVIMLGLGMIAVIVFLKRYHKRTGHIVSVAHERMLEIEDILNMRRGWIYYGLDRMSKQDGNYDFNHKVDNETRAKLLSFHPLDWWQKKRTCHTYSKEEGFRSVRGIFCIFIVMWGVIVMTAVVAVIRVCIKL